MRVSSKTERVKKRKEEEEEGERREMRDPSEYVVGRDGTNRKGRG